MAQIVVRKFTCDRCKKPYDETQTDGKDDSKAHAPKVIFVVESHIPNEKATVMPESIRFEDLCPKCKRRVLDLFDQLRLEKVGDEAPKGDTQTGETAQTGDSSTPATAPAGSGTTGKVDKTPEKTDNKDKGARAGGSADPTTH
jgi:hypothetical protein